MATTSVRIFFLLTVVNMLQIVVGTSYYLSRCTGFVYIKFFGFNPEVAHHYHVCIYYLNKLCFVHNLWVCL